MKNILGIGNALVDAIIFLDDDRLLDTFSLPRGSMQLIDAAVATGIETATQGLHRHRASGGSAANTIHGLAGLGVRTAFLGTVGRDEPGDFFAADLEQSGVTPLLDRSASPTGTSRALVSPDGERTMATFLGAAVELSAGSVNEDRFRGFDHLHLEGYLVLNRGLVEQALAVAKRTGMTVSLDLASYNVVESNLDFLKQICREHVDVVFANEEEARAFTGTSDPHKALDLLASTCSTAVVKIGEKGSLIRHLGQTSQVGIIPVTCIDTTGAGDLYAAGFLYGMTMGWHAADCGRAGALLAGKVVETAGAKITEAGWNFIRENL
jgi:sugar/nucleoside kinase (ribokinase family)